MYRMDGRILILSVDGEEKDLSMMLGILANDSI